MKGGLMAIAGEISGDLHLAAAVRSLKARNPDLHVWGIGGDACEAAGMELKYHVRDMAVLGITEVLKRYGFFRRVFNDMLQKLDEEKPEAILLVDYPGFNLRFAKAAHKRGVKVLYYVCPQVWAWNRKRITRMAEIIDHLMVIFPFEPDVFKNTTLKVDFVGHPLAEEAEEIRQRPLIDLPWGSGHRIALLPGSRIQEIERHITLLLDVVAQSGDSYPESTFLLAAASPRLEDLLNESLAQVPEDVRSRIQVVEGATRAILRQADMGLVCSGTATIEAALQRCPMLVLYKTSALTYLLGRLLIHIPYLGMVNIVASRELCPEFIQGEATPTNLSRAMGDLLKDPSQLETMREGLDQVAIALKGGGAADRCAEIILAEI